jgi:putative membrane protein
MRRNSTLSVCVTFVSAMACAACGDDTTDTTSAGTADTTPATNNTAAGNASGGASGSTGSTRTNTNGNNIGTDSTGATGQSTGANTNAVRLTDAEIASVSMTANIGEIQQNMVGLMRATSDDARGFAQDMVDMHNAALEREKQLAMSMNVSPTENAVTQMLKSNSDQMVAMLQSASDDDFDNVYLRGQLDAHQMTLGLIDTTLLPSAQAQPMKDELAMMRSAVVMHLEHVRDLAGSD